ncbi:MAG: putative toxin-antitoxin system toxin component, PIN family [Phycisphaeraceae bacterium]|nr:MAG: putative toxin-antitoxin system toxin component, PIN family [Phycisphaeraceae bacterium]
MRVVLDTNILLAGIATHGLCEALLTLCYRDHTVVLSEYIIDELRSHYAGKFKAAPEQVEEVCHFFRSQSELVVPAPVIMPDFEDPDDLPVLGTAIAGKAECLVTGDQALQTIKEFQGVRVFSPRAFYDRLRQ